MQKLIQFLTRRRCKSYCQFGQKLPPPYTKTVLNQCIYWVLDIVSALSLPFVVGYLSLLVKGFMQ